MILVAGGQLDINIGVLLRRMLQRAIPFRDLLVGPELTPTLRIDVASGRLELNGEAIFPTACFLRHDVFLNQSVGGSQATALNWYYTVRGWAMSCPSVRCFNRYALGGENNKIENLVLAREVGLMIPQTIITNDFQEFGASGTELVQKPSAGGEYTTLLADYVSKGPGTNYPRIVQPRLQRPELRAYRVGCQMHGFHLASSAIDYRTTKDVEIEPAVIPKEVGVHLMTLCERLRLDFAAADFMRDEEGHLIFLEVNSQPMFAAFDRLLDGKLCDSIIDFLLASTGSQEPQHATGLCA